MVSYKKETNITTQNFLFNDFKETRSINETHALHRFSPSQTYNVPISFHFNPQNWRSFSGFHTPQIIHSYFPFFPLTVNLLPYSHTYTALPSVLSNPHGHLCWFLHQDRTPAWATSPVPSRTFQNLSLEAHLPTPVPWTSHVDGLPRA